MTNAVRGQTRPKYLSPRALLWEIRLPLPGWVSILHRASGILLVLGSLWAVSLLEHSLRSREAFEEVRVLLGTPLGAAPLLLLAWAFVHHLFAGVRFLAIDLGKGVELSAARRSAAGVLYTSVLCTALLAWRIWW